MLVSLDRVLAHLERSKLQVRTVEVNFKPPPIYHSARPAILVIFIGKPVFKPVKGTKLLFATNTNWDIFLEMGSSRYYLLNGDHWLTTPDIEKGFWAAATTLPADLSALPKDDNWADVRANVPGKTAEKMPVVIVSTKPAELSERTRTSMPEAPSMVS